MSKIDWEKFKIVCKKCGKEPEVKNVSYCADDDAPGNTEVKCECGEEELV
jgi:lysyl-tRNA synthetase class I